MQPEMGDLFREVEIEHARLDPCRALLHVDLEHSVHLRRHDHDGLVDRHRTTGQAGARPSGRDRATVAPSDPHATLHLGSADG